ncbi:glycosyltransferase family 25 protein [Amylibacter sp.]|nr:glycosyltransferase family 25 protein [Amylibacter sp.]
MQQAIPVWVINLQKRPDRLLRIGNQLDNMGIKWERINAVDGQVCIESDLEISKKKGEIGELSKSTRGCTASHFKFWDIFFSSDFGHGIVLEDDIELSADFREFVTDTSWIPMDVKLIKLEKFAANRASKLLLGPIIFNSLSNKRHLRKMYSRHCGAGAYLLSKSGAKVLVNWKGKISVPVDHYLFNETVSKISTVLGPFILVPPVAWQSEELGQGSDIDGDGYMQIPKLKKFCRSIKRGFYEVRLWPYQLYILLTRKAKIVLVSISK